MDLECHEDVLCPFPCHVLCTTGFDHSPLLPIATPRCCSRAAPSLPIVSSSTYLPSCLPLILLGFQQPFWTPPRLHMSSSSPPSKTSSHKHAVPSHRSLPVQHEYTNHPGFCKRLSYVLPAWDQRCWIRRRVQIRGLISVRDHLPLLNNVSQIFTLYSSLFQQSQSMPKRLGTKALHWIFTYIYTAHLRCSLYALPMSQCGSILETIQKLSFFPPQEYHPRKIWHSW